MSNFELIIKNARVVTASDTFECDIGINHGRIDALAFALEPGADADVIDAAGHLVLPGGVEAHCHIDEPAFGGAVLADDFLSGSIAAACGGTTTIIPFATQLPDKTLRQSVDDYHAKAADKAIIDYSFHLIVSDPTPQVLGQELPALIAEGYTSFKVYMTYDGLHLNDGQILAVLATAKAHDALVMVHCENDYCIRWLAEQLEQAGNTGTAGFRLRTDRWSNARRHIALSVLQRSSIHRCSSCMSRRPRPWTRLPGPNLVGCRFMPKHVRNICSCQRKIFYVLDGKVQSTSAHRHRATRVMLMRCGVA